MKLSRSSIFKTYLSLMEQMVPRYETRPKSPFAPSPSPFTSEIGHTDKASKIFYTLTLD